jgi:hypothetical protein
MKKFIFILVLFITLTSHAQEKRKNVAISYGFGNGSVTYFARVDGGGSDDGKSLNIFAVNYWEEISKNLFIESGIQYINHKYISTSNYTTNIYKRQVNLISFPFKLRFEAGKLFFLNGGILTDVDINDSRDEKDFSGIGANLGIGLQYYFKEKFAAYINPQLNVRSIISFSGERMPKHLVNSHIALGITYRFK